MSLTAPHTLSDGTTLRVRTVRTPAGTHYYEMPSRKRPTGSHLMRLDGPMFLVTTEQLIPIRHPDYSYASTDKIGAEVALRFFVDGAESCIKEAEKEGIPVEQMYGA